VTIGGTINAGRHIIRNSISPSSREATCVALDSTVRAPSHANGLGRIGPMPDLRAPIFKGPGSHGQSAMNLEDYEKLNPRCIVRHGGLEIVYATPSLETKWRVDTLFEKEPWTVEWIGGFRAGEVLVDVGANVGLYTIWAARTRGATVYAFEPESQNYALLNRNIHYNALGSQVQAFCIALSDRSGLGELHLSRFAAGGSCHSLDERVDPCHRPAAPEFTQGCVAATLDGLLAEGRIAPPQHIKVDVDGFEPKVLRGARSVLRGESVRSLLVEVNQSLPDHREMVRELTALGFKYDPEQVERARRTSGPFEGCAEYVFVR
jgi:FkbM family methyltransferase